MRLHEITLTESEDAISVDDVPESVRQDIIDFLLTNCDNFNSYWMADHGVMSFNETYVAQWLFGYEMISSKRGGYGYGDDAMKLKKVVLDPNEIQGKSVSQATVARYAALNSEPPPVLVYQDGNKWRIAEGGHRLDAAKMSGSKTIAAYDVTHLKKASVEDWRAWGDGGNFGGL